MTDKTIKERLRKSPDDKNIFSAEQKNEMFSALKANEEIERQFRANDELLKQKYSSSSSRKIEVFLNNLCRSRGSQPQKMQAPKVEVQEAKSQNPLRHYLSEKRLNVEERPEKPADYVPLSRTEKSAKYVLGQTGGHFLNAKYKNPESIAKPRNTFHQRYKSNLSLTKKPLSKDKTAKTKNNSLVLSLLAKNFENQKLKKLLIQESSPNLEPVKKIHESTKEFKVEVRQNPKGSTKSIKTKPSKPVSVPRPYELPVSPVSQKIAKNLPFKKPVQKKLAIFVNPANEKPGKEKSEKQYPVSPNILYSPTSKQFFAPNDARAKEKDTKLFDKKFINIKPQIHHFFDAKQLHRNTKQFGETKQREMNSLIENDELQANAHIDLDNQDTKPGNINNRQFFLLEKHKKTIGNSVKRQHIKKLSCKELHPEVMEQFPNSFTRRSGLESREELVAPKFVEIFNNMCQQYETEDVKHLKELLKIRGVDDNNKTSIPETSLQFYQIIKLLGKGSFGRVYLGLQKLTNRLVAIKCLEKVYFKDETTKKKILSEMKILKRLLGHPNIIKLLEVFENKKYVFFVMEYAANGDLLKHIKKKGMLDEEEGRHMFYQIAAGLRYIHRQNIIHRDIKLDNILVDEMNHCKICDFGVSRYMKAHELVNEQCGTPAYLAPEIVREQGYRGFGADIWSLGVLLYCLLTGSMPFKASSIDELHKLIIKGDFEFPDNVNLSSDARDLIKSMLVVDPEKRLNIEEVLKHKWIACINQAKTTVKNIDDFESKQLNYLVEYEYEINEFALNYVCGLGFQKEELEDAISSKQLNHGTACYFNLEKDFI